MSECRWWLLLLFLVACCRGQETFSNGNLAFVVDANGTSIRLIKSPTTTFSNPGQLAPSIWTIGNVSSSCSSCVVSSSRPSAEMATFTYKNCCKSSFIVQVTFDWSSKDQVVLSASASAIPFGQQLQLQLFLSGSPSTQLLYPYGWGTQTNAFANARAKSITYPSTESTTQLWAFWGNISSPFSSLYVASHSAQASPVTWQWDPRHPLACPFQAGKCTGILSAFSEASNVPLTLALRSYMGDWFEAAQYYRQHAEWALRTQGQRPWNGAGIDLFANTGWSPYDVFDVEQGNPQQVIDDAGLLHSLFNVSLGLHWYVWNNVSNFDLRYPQYFPPKDGFQEAVQLLESKYDIRVFPYINGRLYDTKISSFPQHQGQMIYSPNGTVRVESYGNKEPFAVACPSFSWWTNDTIPSVVGSLRQLGVTGVYVDQIAAAVALPCYATNHSHPPGGGDWFARGARYILENSRRFGGPILTENHAEPYVGAADGFLSISSWEILDGTPVPAFLTIYGDRITTIGRIFQPLDLLSNAFVCKSAQVFSYGSIGGWFSMRGNIGIGSQLASFPQQIEYLSKLAMYRRQWWKIGSGSLGTAGPLFQVVSGTVSTTSWVIQFGKSALLLVTNCQSTQQTFSISLDLTRIGFDSATTTLTRVLSDGTQMNPVTSPPRATFTSTIQPLDVNMYLVAQ